MIGVEEILIELLEGTGECEYACATALPLAGAPKIKTLKTQVPSTASTN